MSTPQTPKLLAEYNALWEDADPRSYYDSLTEVVAEHRKILELDSKGQDYDPILRRRIEELRQAHRSS